MLIGVAILAAIAFGLAALLVDRLIAVVPSSWEAHLFPDFSRLQHEPANETERLRQKALDSLIERLAARWPEAPDNLRVGLMDSEQPNALAFPGGLILVTTALLDDVVSENELAFVLGHELGHYRGRDHLQSLGRGLAVGLVMAALGRSGTTADLVALSGQLSSRSFGREQESEADAFGLALVEAEFGHVNGATEFFNRLPSPQTALERSLATYLATHPLTDARVDAMERLARKNTWSTEGELTPLPFP